MFIERPARFIRRTCKSGGYCRTRLLAMAGQYLHSPLAAVAGNTLHLHFVHQFAVNCGAEIQTGRLDTTSHRAQEPMISRQSSRFLFATRALAAPLLALAISHSAAAETLTVAVD